MSYPFDWLTNAPLSTRLEMLLNNFDGFMDINDLEFLSKNPNEINDNNYDYYQNKKNNFYYYHDFPVDCSLSDSYEAVYQKYNRRIERLFNKINENNKVLIVWLSHFTSDLTDDQLVSFSDQINAKFNKKIDICIIENDTHQNESSYKTICLSETITKYQANTYPKSSTNLTLGNEYICNKIFSENITLSGSSYHFMKKKVWNSTIKIFSQFIFFNRRLRKSFRKNLSLK